MQSYILIKKTFCKNIQTCSLSDDFTLMSSKVVDKLHSATTVNETGHVVMLDRQPSSKPEDVKIGQVDGYW
jgi:hypothetical protein